MSKKNKINNLIINPILSPSINFASLKARLRLNEFKKKFSKKDYNNYFQKSNNMNSVTSTMNKNRSLSDLYHSEQKNSKEIKKEISLIDEEIIKLRKKVKNINLKYKLRLKNNYKTNENIKKDKNNIINDNTVIESVKKDISKYLANLHINSDSFIENKIKKQLFENIKLNLNSIKRPKLKTNTIILQEVESNNLSNRLKSRNNNINKFESIDESPEYLQSKLKSNISIKNEKRESLFSKKKLPFLRRKSYIPFSFQEGMNNKLSININNNNNISNDRYIINLPNI